MIMVWNNLTARYHDAHDAGVNLKLPSDVAGGKNDVDRRYSDPFDERIYFCGSGNFAVFLVPEKIRKETDAGPYGGCPCVLLLYHRNFDNDRYG